MKPINIEIPFEHLQKGVTITTAITLSSSAGTLHTETVDINLNAPDSSNLETISEQGSREFRSNHLSDT